MKPETNFFLPDHRKEKVGKETPPDALIMDTLEKLLTTTVDQAHDDVSGAVFKRFIKPRASTMFVHPEYFLDGPGPSIALSGPHEGFFNSVFGILIGGNHF